VNGVINISVSNGMLREFSMKKLELFSEHCF